MLKTKLSAFSLVLVTATCIGVPAHAVEEIQVPQPAYVQAADVKPLQDSKSSEVTQQNQSAESVLPLSQSAAKQQERAAESTSTKPALAQAPLVSKSNGSNHLISKLPHRIALFAAGVFVGTPLAVIHQSGKESITGVTDLVGTNRNPFVLAPAMILSLPFGIASGIIGGPTTTAYSSLKHCGDDHISKETLGIGSGK